MSDQAGQGYSEDYKAWRRERFPGGVLKEDINEVAYAAWDKQQERIDRLEAALRGLIDGCPPCDICEDGPRVPEQLECMAYHNARAALGGDHE